MTPEELKEVEERWKPGTILPETSIYDYLGHCASDVITLLAYIQELQEIAGKWDKVDLKNEEVSE